MTIIAVIVGWTAISAIAGPCIGLVLHGMHGGLDPMLGRTLTPDDIVNEHIAGQPGRGLGPSHKSVIIQRV